jgi:hypothetical protein
MTNRPFPDGIARDGAALGSAAGRRVLPASARVLSNRAPAGNTDAAALSAWSANRRAGGAGPARDDVARGDGR